MSLIKFECGEKIIEQMKKNVCKIIVDQMQGTGFFCKIPFPDNSNMLPILITASHVINDEFLNKDDAKIVLEIKHSKEID